MWKAINALNRETKSKYGRNGGRDIEKKRRKESQSTDGKELKKLFSASMQGERRELTERRGQLATAVWSKKICEVRKDFLSKKKDVMKMSAGG